MNRISAYILTFNEAERIADAIKSVAWADEVLIVDSNSTDETVKIAESLGARVLQVKFEGFGSLRNSAIQACSHSWIFSLDADEFCPPAVSKEARQHVCELKHRAFFVPRRNYFLGSEIKHSGWFPNYRQPQLFHREAMRYEISPVHEGFELSKGETFGHFKNAIWQLPFKDMSASIAKMNRYSSLGATKRRQAKSSYGKAFRHAIWAFIRHYIFKRGVLDGWAGFIIAFSYFEVTFYRYVKAVELDHQKEWHAQWEDISRRN